MTAIDWSRLYRERKSIERRFGGIWRVPLARRYSDVLATLVGQGTRVLEIGAGDRSLGDRIARWGGSYRSCDIDASHPHDFVGVDAISGEYDLVCAFEMIEHVTLTEAARVLAICHERLAQGGRVALTTPNIFYPPAFLRDATHVTPFCYDELGGLLALTGFEVTAIYRLHHDAVLKKLLKRVILYPLYRATGIDFAHQVMVVARKP